MDDAIKADYDMAERLARQLRPPMAERLARIFHDTYERLAPEHGWETNPLTKAKPWSEVPEHNRALMVAVIWELLDAGIIEPGSALNEHEESS